MGSMVMTARKKFDVPYPNLYATPGFHKQADDFNRVQRGHQSLFEHLTAFTALALLGGLKHPITAAISGVFFCLGNYLFLVGYADASLAVESARYKKGGVFKPLGVLLALGTCISFSGSVAGWW
jgi:glutathione S-transferase